MSSGGAPRKQSPGPTTRRSILGSLFVHGALTKATLTGARRRDVELELMTGDELPSDDTFDAARDWLVGNQLVNWNQATGERHHEMTLGPGWGYGIGVVLGHQSIRCGVGDARASFLIRNGKPLVAGAAAPLLDDADARTTMRLAAELTQQVVVRGNIGQEHIRGVTLAVPAPIDLEGNLTNDRILRGFPDGRGPRAAFAHALESVGLGGVRVDVDNDANVAGIGEWHARQHTATPPTNLLAVKVSGGIGGAFINEHGRVHRGATGAAGELGHVPTDISALPEHAVAVDLPDLDPQTACARCGAGQAHLENYSSAAAISDRLFSATGDVDYSERHQAMLAILRNHTDPDFPRARQAVYDSGWILGRALMPIVEFLDPDLIVITGRMRAARDVFTDAVTDGLSSQDRLSGPAPEVVASDNNWTGVLGAIRNTMENQPPPFPPLLGGVLTDLRRDMRLGPKSWQMAVPLLGPPS